MKKIKVEWVGPVGGLLTLLALFLPFEPHRSLFAILENTPLPFFSPSLVLLTALALVLQDRKPAAARALALALLLGWLVLFVLLLWVFTPAVLGQLAVGAFLLPLGLAAMLCPPYGA